MMYHYLNMNRRSAKVQRIGNTSLAIVLPKDWTRGMDIEAGDRVEIVYNGIVEIRKRQEGLSDE